MLTKRNSIINPICWNTIFLNFLFNHIQNENIDVDKLKDASLGIIQSFYVLVTYGLEPNSHNVWSRQSKNIEEILNSPLAEKVKFLTILKYITKKYCGTSLKKLDQDKNLPQLIKLLYSFGTPQFRNDCFTRCLKL